MHKRHHISAACKQKLKENQQNIMISVIWTSVTLKWHLMSMENFHKLSYESKVKK